MKIKSLITETKGYLRFYFRNMWKPEFGSIQKQLQEYSRFNKHTTFIQIGANDGWTADPYNKFIIAYNWSGVLVEPLPEAFQRLEANYRKYKKKIRFENCAIGAHCGSSVFYQGIPDETHPFSVTRLSSFDKQKVENLREVYPDVRIEEIIVPVLTLSELVRKHEIENLDILLIDAEGYDWVILKTIDFQTIRPKIIVYEHTNLTEVEKRDSWDFLQKCNYNILIEKRDTMAILI